MKKGGSLGLIYRRQRSEKLSANNSRITISFKGKLIGDKQQCITSIEEHPNVLKVINITASKANPKIIAQNK